MHVDEEDFVGRGRELAVLERAWHSDRGAFIPVYGRRRIGKSKLILQFLQHHTGVYFIGKQAPAALQLREFLVAAADAVREPLLADLALNGWKSAFEAVVSRWRGPGKLVLALDEFQWMVETSPELPSILQELWDREWQASAKVQLLVCGSFIGFMEREILGEKSPLFGRRTAQIHLQPFDLREARAFHPNWSLADVARVRFVAGGVPLYLRAFEAGRSFEESLRKTLLDEFAPLFREPEFLLREELREVQNYSGILSVLAQGSLPLPQLALAAGVPERNVGYYLQQLAELGYVGRRWPLDGNAPAARHVRWHLTDPLLRFWYRFVFPHGSAIRQFGPERAFRQFVEPRLQAWCGTSFEGLCREALPLIYADEGVVYSTEPGEYWSREVQIDVVGLRDDRWIDLCECKWGEVPSRPALVAELRAKAGLFRNPKGATLGLRIFSNQAPTAAEAKKLGVKWHSLADIYGARDVKSRAAR